MIPPIEIYNLDNALSADQRKGTAYCLRKGKHKKIEHDLENSVLIDGKSHQEIADIFKRVKTFISYDAYTGYSMFAALCGADSIVIPDEGMSELEWYPEVSQRYGVAYGFNRLDLARSTQVKVLEEVLQKENEIEDTVHKFVNEVSDYFD